MEGPDEVLAVARVDSGLAAHGGIHLRQERGRHLHEAHAATQDRGGEPRQIADHAPAQRQDDVAPLAALVEQPFHRLRQPGPAFRGFPRFQQQRGGLHARHPVAQTRQMQLRHPSLRDDEDPRAAQERRDQLSGPREQPLPDVHVIGAVAQGHVNDLAHVRMPASRSLATTRSTICGIGRSGAPSATTRAAS